MMPLLFLRDAALAFLVSALAGLLLIKPVMALLKGLGSKQNVSAHLPEHQVKQGTPTMGGILIVAASLIAMVILAPKNWFAVSGFLLFALIGFIDDFIAPKKMGLPRGLPWRAKLLMQIVAAFLMSLDLGAIFGRSIAEVSPWATAITVFIILFLSNAYNFTDGLDGLAGSVGIAFCFGLIALFSLALPFGSIGIVSGAIGGALLAFLFLNAPPARVFLGDVGSLPIGAMLGFGLSQLLFGGELLPRGNYHYYYIEGAVLSSSVFYHVSQIAPSVLLLCGVMMAELIPVPLQILSVKVRKKKLFLKTPIHHAFEEKGIPETKIVWWFTSAQLLLSVAAIATAIWFTLGGVVHS